MGRARATFPPSDPTSGLPFLLSQVGAHAAARFSDRLASLNLTAPHAGILRVIRDFDGLSQQALGEKLGVFPSRLVVLLDELEQRGLIERRDNPADRRSYALHLTTAGLESWEQIARIRRELHNTLCAALDESEQVLLTSFLTRIAEEQQLLPGIHPGFRKLGGRQG
jgi:DNA-binding MarR family transcriptional regulator